MKGKRQIMKFVFRGWQRELTAHKHNVAPVDFSTGRYVAKAANQPIVWNGPLSALGKVTNLGLSGSFLVEFTFEQAELQNWLEVFAKNNPADALRMMAPIQAEAMISLSSSSRPEAKSDAKS